MRTPTGFTRKPDAYFIVVDGELLIEAGVAGVIKDKAVAMSLRDVLVRRYPGSTIELFGAVSVERS